MMSSVAAVQTVIDILECNVFLLGWTNAQDDRYRVPTGGSRGPIRPWPPSKMSIVVGSPSIADVDACFS